jgi:8-oxo-dGTP pyrophosphatase MutT (NUDIX family)
MRFSLETLRTRLLAEPPALPLKPSRSDYDLNPGIRTDARSTLVPSAVLIPVIARPEPTVLFTQRSQNLPRHPGQVSFPGGCADEADTSLVHTAIRELEEETGIAGDFVTPLGFLEPYETVTGFAVLPVVGWLREGFSVNANAHEVDDVFEVPLAFLVDPANCREEHLEWKGASRRFYAFTYETHYIWGATAAILVEFAERLA